MVEHKTFNIRAMGSSPTLAELSIENLKQFRVLGLLLQVDILNSTNTRYPLSMNKGMKSINFHGLNKGMYQNLKTTLLKGSFSDFDVAFF